MITVEKRKKRIILDKLQEIQDKIEKLEEQTSLMSKGSIKAY